MCYMLSFVLSEGVRSRAPFLKFMIFQTGKQFDYLR